MGKFESDVWRLLVWEIMKISKTNRRDGNKNKIMKNKAFNFLVITQVITLVHLHNYISKFIIKVSYNNKLISIINLVFLLRKKRIFLKDCAVLRKLK